MPGLLPAQVDPQRRSSTSDTNQRIVLKHAKRAAYATHFAKRFADNLEADAGQASQGCGQQQLVELMNAKAAGAPKVMLSGIISTIFPS